MAEIRTQKSRKLSSIASTLFFSSFKIAPGKFFSKKALPLRGLIIVIGVELQFLFAIVSFSNFFLYMPLVFGYLLSRLIKPISSVRLDSDILPSKPASHTALTQQEKLVKRKSLCIFFLQTSSYVPLLSTFLYLRWNC